jgi:hypothetical protein
MKHLSLYAVLAALLVTTSLSHAADSTYYRWADEHGNPVHSDRPPPEGIDYEVVSTGSRMVRKVSAEEGAVPADIQPSPGNEFSQVDTAENTAIKKNPEFCARARDNLEALDTYARIRIRDDNGEYRYIDEEEKEEQRIQARDLIRRHCE